MKSSQPHLDNPVHANRAFSLWLDLFRWFAALLVLLGHAERGRFMRITEIAGPDRPLLYYPLAFCAGFAHPAVMVFFVLSGYLVGGGLLKEIRLKGRIDFPKYFLNRFSRMSVVLYPSLLAILLFDLIGIHVFHGISTGVYTPDVSGNLSPSVIICNAAFMQSALCEKFGNDGALWSLYNEFWYYMIWPVILLGCTVAGIGRRLTFLAAAAVALVVFTFFQHNLDGPFAPYMLIWLLGVGIALAKRPLIPSTIVAAGVCLAVVLGQRLFIRESFGIHHPISAFLLDLSTALSFAVLVLSMKHHKGLREPVWGMWNMKLAAFSFSLYCLHIPILNLYSAFLMYRFHTGWNMVPDTFAKWAILGGGVALSIVIAWLFSLVTEAHTAQVRDWLRSLSRTPLLRAAGDVPSLMPDQPKQP
jgi:peptidoglycan/LPS O-acetylase OafA/YrhL